MQFMIRGNSILKCLLCAGLSLVLLGAMKTNASSASPLLTQGELIQWLVQLSGDSGTLPTKPTTANYVTWAKGQGLTPAGGWSPNTVLTRDVLAQVLVQFFALGGKAGTDPIKILQREGIDIPGLCFGGLFISRSIWSSLCNDGSFFPWAHGIYNKCHSKHKTPSHHKTPPKPKTPPCKHPTRNHNMPKWHW
jgi:hypothetical protein